MAIIPVGTKYSDVIDTAGGIPAMLFTPSTITSSFFTFEIMETATGEGHNLCDGNGGQYKVTLSAAGDAIPLDVKLFSCVKFFQIVAGSVESGSDKTIGIGKLPR